MRFAFRTALAAGTLAATALTLATAAAQLAEARFGVAMGSGTSTLADGEAVSLGRVSTDLPGPRIERPDRQWRVHGGVVPQDLLDGDYEPAAPMPDFRRVARIEPLDAFRVREADQRQYGMDHEAARQHLFSFTRAIYSDGGGFNRGFRRGGGSWDTDWDKADNQFIVVLSRLLDIDAYQRPHAIRLDDPELRRFPFIYALEVGRIYLTDAELEGLRSYLLAGGFLVIDDFWGSREWFVFEREMQRLFPEYPIVEMSLDHEIFNMVYDIEHLHGEIKQVPQYNRGCQGDPSYYYEQDGYTAHARGIFDDKGRLMVIINWNTDLGDAWEWMELACYPLDRSTFASQMGMNFIIYALSH